MRIRRTRSGGALIDATREEAHVLRRLLDDVVALLTAPDGADPAARRLLPDAYADDPDAAAEFRELTERSVSEGKLETVRTMSASLAGTRVELDRETAVAWVRALNDARLLVATRLGIGLDAGPRPSADADSGAAGRPGAHGAAIAASVHDPALHDALDLLTWMQARMLAVIGEDL